MKKNEIYRYILSTGYDLKKYLGKPSQRKQSHLQRLSSRQWSLKAYHHQRSLLKLKRDIRRTQYSLLRPQKHGHVVNTQGIQIEPKPESQFNPRLEWYRIHGKMPSVKKRFGIFSPLKQSPTRKISQQDMTSTRYCSLFQFLVLSSVCKCWAWKFDGKNREWAYLSI